MTTLGAGLALLAASISVLPFFTLRQTRAATGVGVGLSKALPGSAWAAAAFIAAIAAAAIAAYALGRAAPDGGLAAGIARLLRGEAGLAARRGPSGVQGRAAAPATTPPRAPSAARAALVALVALAAAAAPLAIAALALGAKALALEAGTLARVSFGAGFWAGLAGSWLAARGASSLAGRPASAYAPMAALAAAAAAVVAIGLAGGWSDLAIARELASRRGRFVAALAEHLAYALFPTLAAAAAALPLGRAATRRPGLEKAMFSIAAIAQTIPTLSLLGLLVVPLSALRAAVPALGSIGFSGVGWAPASIALFLYALLPILAHSAAGFSGVPKEARDAGLGAGMDGGQLFFKVELPLAAPALIAGLRTALAQNLGNAALAGLIGGGGLGGLVFLGLAQAAPDLILLGALPVVALAFAADRLLGLAEAAAARAAGVGAVASESGPPVAASGRPEERPHARLTAFARGSVRETETRKEEP